MPRQMGEIRMKIAIIHGQNHKGSSYHTGRLLVDQIAGENEITEFFLPRDLNHFCLGCYRCIENDADCPWHEKKRVIVDAMEAADLLVFTTPTYCMAPSAPMKSLLDLTFTMWMAHRPRGSMFRKKAVVLSTAAGSSTAGATGGIAQNLFYWGVPEIHRYGARVQAKNWDDVKPAVKEKITNGTRRSSQKSSAETRRLAWASKRGSSLPSWQACKGPDGVLLRSRKNIGRRTAGWAKPARGSRLNG